MNERDACDLLIAHHGARRARYILGALRMLALYGEDEVRRRGLISPGGLELIRRAVDHAGVPWPSPSDEGKAARAGE